MAGMLPGVEVHRRRSRTYSHHLYKESRYTNRSLLEPHPTMIIDTTATATSTSTSTSMDVAALNARQRLGEKLGYSRPSRRFNSAPENEGRVKKGDMHDRHLAARIVGTQYLQKSGGRGGLICAVCLEDLGTGGEQQVMELPCSHKYHSQCLLPWLSAHPNCPTCRSPLFSTSS